MEHQSEKSVYTRLWQACAGGMTQIPPVGSLVYYFPEGHAEHAKLTAEESHRLPTIPSHVACRVSDIKHVVDCDNEEVYLKLELRPVADTAEEEGEPASKPEAGEEERGVFSKTLTQSDANNGGGFSVPRYCAETLFPRLDYTSQPPVQTIHARDLHGEVWAFRHIYRGTPRRHLLTTGWSYFVNQKKLVAGDSIVFLKAQNGELCVGIRRARNRIGGSTKHTSEWRRKKPTRLTKTMTDHVVEAVGLAASGKPFVVVYYPRAGTPEFFVRASVVREAMRVKWSKGMRFKMAFETEESSRISWFLGTIDEPMASPSSPWRCLQVYWDEHDLLNNVTRVNPWMVEVVLAHASFHHSTGRKKTKPSPPLDFAMVEHLAVKRSLCSSTGIQEAKHDSMSGLSSHNFFLQRSFFDPYNHIGTPSSSGILHLKNGSKSKPMDTILLFGKHIQIYPQQASSED